MNLDFRSEKALEGARAFAAARHDGHRCGECRFAQVFAVQPRAVCVAGDIESTGKVMTVTRRACRHFAMRTEEDTVIAQSLARPAIESADDTWPLPDFPAVETAPAVGVRWAAPARVASLR